MRYPPPLHGRADWEQFVIPNKQFKPVRPLQTSHLQSDGGFDGYDWLCLLSWSWSWIIIVVWAQWATRCSGTCLMILPRSSHIYRMLIRKTQAENTLLRTTSRANYYSSALLQSSITQPLQEVSREGAGSQWLSCGRSHLLNFTVETRDPPVTSLSHSHHRTAQHRTVLFLVQTSARLASHHH